MSITTNKNFVDLYFKLVETYGLQRNGLEFLIEGYDYLPNPFSTDLSEREQHVITEKVHEDFWYLAKEIIMIPIAGSKNPVRFSINKTNLASLLCMCEGHNVFASQQRQLFGTMTRVVFALWKLIVDDKDICVFSPKNVDSRYFIEKIIMINKNLPEYIRLDDDDIKSRIISSSGGSSLAFLNEFEGLVVINDLEHIDGVYTFLQKAKEKIEDGVIQVTANSTVGNFDTSGRYTADKIIEKGVKWNDQYFRSKMLRNTIHEKFAYVIYSYTELVEEPEEWFRLQCKYIGDGHLAISREILLER